MASFPNIRPVVQRWVIPLVLVQVGGLGAATRGLGQTVPTAVPLQASIQAAPVPFGPGERFDYQVKWGIFNIGRGSLAVVGVDDIRGTPSYKLKLLIHGGRLGISVDYDHSSWLGIADLVSRRFFQDSDERGRERRRRYEIYPEERRWELRHQTDTANGWASSPVDDAGEILDDAPLDEISFLYWVRTLPLEVGQTYTYHNYFKDRGNPVVLHVLRRETIEVPAGTFETIVVQPIIRSRGLFSEGGEAEVFFTDDEDRLLVRLETKLKIGNLSLHLESSDRGRPLTAWVKPRG